MHRSGLCPAPESLIAADNGKGPLVVLIHGLEGTPSHFAPQAQSLKRLARCVSIRLPGHDGSPGALLPTVQSVSSQVARYLRQVDASSCLVVGHSTGGVIGLDLASRFPAVLNGLVIIDSNVPADAAGFTDKRSRLVVVDSDAWREKLVDQLRSVADSLTAIVDGGGRQ